MRSWARITRTLLSMFFRTGKGEKKRRVSAVVVVLLGLLFGLVLAALAQPRQRFDNNTEE